MYPDQTCKQSCDSEALIYKNQLYYGEKEYYVFPNVTQIQLEIMNSGPVVAVLTFYEDFITYKGGQYFIKSVLKKKLNLFTKDEWFSTLAYIQVI